ncbi:MULTISPECIES: hypothetical protein [unclassified Streptomyces]|uniref:hypothetical protein n=1 Tax=unclassified Streptomyces TaxID=2593676 RepID=UPI0035E038DC
MPESHVVRSGFDVPGGRAAAERLLALRPRPTAVFAVNDFAAIGVMAEVRDAGLVARASTLGGTPLTPEG